MDSRPHVESRFGCIRPLKASKRGNGEGSIYANTRGVWTGVVSLPDGRRKYMYGGTREEVRRKLALALAGREKGELADARGRSLGEYLDEWLEAIKPAVSDWTYRGYEVHVRVHIKPRFARMPLERLEPSHVQAFLNQKLAGGLSPKSVRNLRATFRAALNQAIRWGFIHRNAAALVDGPRVERYEIQPLTPPEARQFLTSLRGHRLEALYSVALAIGLRRCEALGLRWQDVDLDMGYLRVAKQLKRSKGTYELRDPKSRASRRTIVLPPIIIDRLREHRARQLTERGSRGGNWNNLDLVFVRPDGKPLDPTGISKLVHRLLDAARLPQRRLHDLRHSCATLLLAQGVSARVVMEILGHSQITTTMNTYMHVIPEMRRDAAAKIQGVLIEPPTPER